MSLIKKLTISHKIEYYGYALFLLLCNASTFFGVKWGNVITLMVIVVAGVIAMVKRYLPLPEFKKLGTLLILFMFSNFVNIRNGVNWSSALIFIGDIISIYIIQSCFEIRCNRSRTFTFICDIKERK